MYLTLKKIDRIISQTALSDEVRPFVSTPLAGMANESAVEIPK